MKDNIPPPSAKTIIRNWLYENGYDGLVDADPLLDEDDVCGCDRDDLCPCGELCIERCIAAYLHKDGLYYQEKEEEINGNIENSA